MKSLGTIIHWLGLATVVPANLWAGNVPEGSAAVDSFHFAHRISPILAKVGCSAAECHGGGNGQGGFKLSLFAAEPRLDYEAIVEELGGRRLDLGDPSKSLLLKKPTRAVKHKGGRLLREGDENLEDLIAWIDAGAPYASGEQRELNGISVEPVDGGVKVVAGFDMAGGKVIEEDVTRLALLESTNRQVAEIDDEGGIVKKGPGETWILARYGQFSARIPIREAFPGSVANRRPAAAVHPLDAAWLQRMDDLGLAPAPRASDSVLVRRLYFDLTGRPPTPYEVWQFEALPRRERVASTAGRLVESSEFAGVFARHVGDWFEIPPESKDPRNASQRNNVIRKFLLDSVGRNDSISAMTRKFLTEKEPQTAWKHFADPRDRSEYVGRTMLGIRIGCARCHNHPLDRWTNIEHLHFSAYFADPRPADGGGMMAGKFFLPGTSQSIEPVLLPLGEGTPPDNMILEEELAWFVLERGREQFARNMANRIFGDLVGAHLVDMPDDHRLSNPSLHEPILALLAGKFLDSGADLKSMVRFIVTSELYALSSEPPDADRVSGDPELRYLARREARPLTTAQFKAAVEHVLGVPIDRPDPPDSPLARQLYVMNSGLILEGLETPGNQVDVIFDFEQDPFKQLEEMYRLILSRMPGEEERKALLPVLTDAREAKQAGRDLAFALMAGREFGSLR